VETKAYAREIRAAIALVVLAPSVSGVAWAGPPFQTDDPEPTPYRYYEIYVNSQSSHDGDVFSGTFPTLEINYGLMPNVQFSVDVSTAVGHAPRTSWDAGLGDTGIGLKVRFIQQSTWVPDVSFYPSVVLPTGDAKLGLGGGQTKTFLPLWAQKDFSGWEVFGGGGVWHNPGLDSRDYAFTGLAVQRDFNDSFSAGAEMFHTTASTVGGSSATGFSIGFIKSLGELHKVLFSVGRGLDGSNTFSGYAAYELFLGPKGKAPPDAR
jgi:hypothetical protein